VIRSDTPFTDILRPFKPRYIRTSAPSEYFASAAFAVAGRVWIAPIDVHVRCVINRLIYQVGTAQVGNVRLGLYREGATIDKADGGDLVVESASVVQSPAAAIQMVTVPDTLLNPGRYYVAIQGDDPTGTFRNFYDPGNLIARYYDQAYGAFTDPCPVTTATNRIPIMFLRVLP